MATKKQINHAWETAKTIKGKSPEQYRQDPYGNEMYKASYGKTSAKGWDVDHINPKAKGGSESLGNIQALNSSVNRSLQDSNNKKSRHD